MFISSRVSPVFLLFPRRFCIQFRLYSDESARRRIPALPDLQKELIRKPAEKIPDSRLLKVAILGEPNAGKSTLTNQLSGWATCSVSKKVHTTRKMSQTVLIEGATQIIFLDTPGLTVPSESKKHNLETSFLTDPEKAMAQADLLLVLHDASNKWTRSSLSPKILRLLHLYPDKESILALNKVDCVREKALLLNLVSQLTEGIVDGQRIALTPTKPKTTLSKSITEFPLNTPPQNAAPLQHVMKNLAPLSESQVAAAIKDKIGWPHFSKVFFISALDGDGVSEVSEHLLNAARPGNWIYNSSVVTDQNPHEMAIATVREKLLDFLTDELPYTIQVSIRMWDVDSLGTLNIVMNIDCRKAFTARLVVGTGGRTIMQIARETEQKLRNLFRCEVRLRLVVEPNQIDRK